MKTEVVEDGYSRDDLRRELLIWAEKELSVPQFYEWLPFCLVKKKPFYSRRDVQKFLFIANELKRDRSLERAKQRLIERLNNHPEEFANG